MLINRDERVTEVLGGGITCLEDRKGVLRSMIQDVVAGIDLAGHKKCPGIWLDQSESRKCRRGMRNGFQNRGVGDVLYFSVDGLTDFPEAISALSWKPQWPS